jgi:hypothetical protein
MADEKTAIYNIDTDEICEHDAADIFVSFPVQFTNANFLAGPCTEHRLHKLAYIRDVDGRQVLFVNAIPLDEPRPDVGIKFHGTEFDSDNYYGMDILTVLNELADHACDWPSALGCIGLTHLWEVDDHEADIVESSKTGVSGWDYMHPTERAAERVYDYIAANQIDDPYNEMPDRAKFIADFPLCWDT